MRISRMLSVVGFVAATVALGSAGCSGGSQAAFPSTPITMIVPFAPGGAADLSARALSEASQKYMGQPVVVQNVEGGAGAVGFAQGAKAKPDGYTLTYTTGNFLVVPHFENVPYKPLEDFAPVIQVGGFPTILSVRADSPFKTLKDMLDYAKSNPGKVRFSSSGFGSLHHALVEWVGLKAGVQMTHVPFKSLAEGVTAMLGGNVEAATSIPSDIVAHLKEGRVRALGIFLPERFSGLPDIATIKEQGYDITSFGWWAVAAPKATPDSVIEKLHDSFKKGMADAPFTTYMRDGLNPILYLSPKDTLAKWKKDYEDYGAIAKAVKK